jgi:heme o synthase
LKTVIISPYTHSLVMTRAGDYFQLARPRLALLVLITVAAGWQLAAGIDSQPLALVHTLIATALLFAGASALNQLLERDSDALMPRTANRPLPAGKVEPWEVLVIGCSLSVGGLVELLTVSQYIAAALGAFAVVSYVFVYTPLKNRTTLNTVIGAISGAVPPLMGWAAARGRLDAEALTLFLILFLWQVPHFLAIAWVYRDQYTRAGLLMLPVVDSDGKQTGRQMLRFSLLLIVASLFPFVIGQVGWISALVILLLGTFFLRHALAFTRAPTTVQARRVFLASLLYLPALLLVLVLDTKLPRSGPGFLKLSPTATLSDSTSDLTALELRALDASHNICASSEHVPTQDPED